MLRYCALLFVATPLLAQPPAKVDPAVAAARELAGYTPKFTDSLFTGDKFPELLPSPKGTAVDVTFYDRKYAKVAEAKEPGPYIAVCELITTDGRKSRRYVPLVKVPADHEGDKSKSFLEKLGIPFEAVARNEVIWPATLTSKVTFDAVKSSPFAARLIAGMHFDDGKGKYPARKYDDAMALERQWVVGLKRKLNGWDKQFPNPVTVPSKLDTSAPVVREGTADEAGVKADTSDKLDAVLKKWAADSDQAFAVCVVRKGIIVHHKAYGTRDGKPMAVDTKSWMASVTKTMSATLLMTLVDRGLVGLDDEVSKYLPALKEIAVKKPLKIRNLLNHTGGLAEFSLVDDLQDDADERLVYAYPLLKVGEKWAYGGTGNALAGKIVEAVTGDAVPVAFHKYILGPLEMKHTDVAGTHADAFSVPLDMAKFGQMFLNQGSYGNMQFMKPETFEKMLPRKLTVELGPDATKTFGLGLDGQSNKFGHGAASSATFSVDVENQLVVIMTRNKAGTNDGKHNGAFHEAIKAGLLK
jgi:CubicO group peptidase (beta-lactamase class C family)